MCLCPVYILERSEKGGIFFPPVKLWSLRMGNMKTKQNDLKLNHLSV